MKLIAIAILATFLLAACSSPCEQAENDYEKVQKEGAKKLKKCISECEGKGLFCLGENKNCLELEAANLKVEQAIQKIHDECGDSS